MLGSSMDPKTTSSTDRVILRRIPFNIQVGLDAWGRAKSQPVLLSLEIPYDFQQAATNDDVSHTLDYGKLYKLLGDRLSGKYVSINHLFESVRAVLDPVKYFLAEIALPKANLRAERGLHAAFELREGEDLDDVALVQSLSIRGIRCACIVGVNPHEREEKQCVLVNLEFKRTDHVLANEISFFLALESKAIIPGVPYADVTRRIVRQIEGSAYQTIEALATAIARTVTVEFGIPGVWVEIEKPNAIAAIEAAGVRIYRDKSYFTDRSFWHVRQP